MREGVWLGRVWPQPKWGNCKTFAYRLPEFLLFSIHNAFPTFFFLNCEYTYFLLAKKDISIKVEQITKVTPKLTRSNNLSPSDLTTLQNESKMKPVWFLPIYLFLVASRELSVSNKRSLHTSYYRPNNTGYYDRSVNLVNWLTSSFLFLFSRARTRLLCGYKRWACALYCQFGYGKFSPAYITFTQNTAHTSSVVAPMPDVLSLVLQVFMFEQISGLWRKYFHSRLCKTRRYPLYIHLQGVRVKRVRLTVECFYGNHRDLFHPQN